MKKVLLPLVFFLVSTSLYASEKIGFKGVYLGQSAEEACHEIQKRFSKEKYTYRESIEIDAFMSLMLDLSSGDVCFTNSMTISMDKKKKVAVIIGRFSAFGIEKMEVDEFGQLVVDNIKWVQTLSGGEQGYFYEDGQKGYRVEIPDGSNPLKPVSLIVRQIPIIQNKPNFN